MINQNVCHRCGEQVFRSSELKKAWWFDYENYLCPVCWERERISLLNPLPQKTFDFQQPVADKPIVIHVYNDDMELLHEIPTVFEPMELAELLQYNGYTVQIIRGEQVIDTLIAK